MRPFPVLFALITACSIAAGCAHPTTGAAGTPTTAAAIAPPAADRSRPATSETAASADLAECREVSIHFDQDTAEIRLDERALLERIARCLQADSRMHVTVEGNADERGTDEYNLALGDRRANAVQTYLEQLGVSGRQLRAVSYGKERPLCTSHDEACWSQNRRASVVGAR